MASKQLSTGTYADDTLEDGFVRVEAGGRRIAMSMATYTALIHAYASSEVFPEMRRRGDGLHLIPPGLLHKDEADEVRRALAESAPTGDDPGGHRA